MYQRGHAQHEIFDALRWLVQTAAERVYMSHEFPARMAPYQPTQHCIAAIQFAAPTHELCVPLCIAASREPDSTTVILDNRPLHPTPTSGGNAVQDGMKHNRARTLNVTVYTLAFLPTSHSSTPADAQGHAQVALLLSIGVTGCRQSPRLRVLRSGLHRDRAGNCGRVTGHGADGRYAPADEMPLLAAVRTTGRRTPLRLAYRTQTAGARLRVDHPDAHSFATPNPAFSPPRTTPPGYPVAHTSNLYALFEPDGTFSCGLSGVF